MNMGEKVWLWLRRVTAMRVAIAVSLLFVIVHLTIESDAFRDGPLSKNGFVHLMDLKALDLKFTQRSVAALPPPKVVIAAIDERSVDRFGLWPWNRAIVGQFIRAATVGGAKVIGFDAVFSDEDKNSSYAAINKFFAELKGATLSPESPQARELVDNLRQQVTEHGKTLALLATLEKHTKNDTALHKTLEQARQSTATGKQTLEHLDSVVEEWNKRSAPFFERAKMSGESPDAILAAAIAASPQTILGYFNFYQDKEIVGVSRTDMDAGARYVERSGIDHIYETVQQQVGGQVVSMQRPAHDVLTTNAHVRPVIAMRAPLLALAENAKSFGFFNAMGDADGPMRSVEMLNLYKNKLYPSLSLISAAHYLGGDIRPLNAPGMAEGTIGGISLLPGVEVPTDSSGKVFINYYNNPMNYFPVYSIADIIDGTVPADAYKDKVLLFGMTATGLFDARSTPFGAAMPGVYVHASVIQNIIDDNYLVRPLGSVVLGEALLYLMLSIFMGWALPKLPVWAGLLATVGFAVGFYLVDVHYAFANGVWLLNVLPTLQAFSVFIGTSLYGYLTEGREKRQIRKAFQYYLTASVVDEMLKDTSKLRLGGERRVCTVLFSDIRGFTTISEALSPEELVHLLNSYLTPMTDLVFKYDGTLDKYMGDAIMAIFGAPVAYDNHPSRACYVALEMMQSLTLLQAEWRAQKLPEIDIGIGLNTGPMSVGNMGSSSRFDYTVMGDNVNLGSRLEGINKEYGTNIIISEYTYLAAKNDVHARLMDAVRVKGKKEPVQIYELLGRGAPTQTVQALITLFEQGVALYRQQRWDDAIDVFTKIRKDIRPDDYPSEMYLERCQQMRQEPPGAAWDGVYTMKTK